MTGGANGQVGRITAPGGADRTSAWPHTVIVCAGRLVARAPTCDTPEVTSRSRSGAVQAPSAGAIGWTPMDTLTPAEAAQILGTSPNRVRQLLRDRKLMAVPGSGNGKIPADFLLDGEVLKHLSGLRTVLADGGFSEQEAFDWLFREDDTLPGTPVQALRDDRHTEVTRRAQALAL